MNAALLTALAFQLFSPEQVPRPAADSWISDQAGVIDAAAAQRIDRAIDELNAEIGLEIAVVTVGDVPGETTPKQFATRLFNHWGIGQAAHDNGLLLLLVIDQRRLEIEVGTGMEEVVSRGWSEAMQRESIVPRFRDGDYAGGIEAGLARIAERLRTGPAESESGGDPAPAAGEAEPVGDGPSPPWGGIFLGSLAACLGLSAGLGIARSRRRERTCLQCQTRSMVALDEIADDAHLSEGQRAEEQVGSVDHIVYVCPGCQWSRTVQRRRWFSGYGVCSACSFRTTRSSSRTVVEATYAHGGEIEVTTTCSHCSHTSSHITATARRTHTSSYSSYSSRSSGGSSGGGGRSFGGGSSRGGGGGSSW